MHFAAQTGNIEIVSMFLFQYHRMTNDSSFIPYHPNPSFSFSSPISTSITTSTTTTMIEDYRTVTYSNIISTASAFTSKSENTSKSVFESDSVNNSDINVKKSKNYVHISDEEISKHSVIKSKVLSVRSTDNHGVTALHLAVFEGHFKVVKELLEASNKPKIRKISEISKLTKISNTPRIMRESKIEMYVKIAEINRRQELENNPKLVRISKINGDYDNYFYNTNMYYDADIFLKPNSVENNRLWSTTKYANYWDDDEDIRFDIKYDYRYYSSDENNEIMENSNLNDENTVNDNDDKIDRNDKFENNVSYANMGIRERKEKKEYLTLDSGHTLAAIQSLDKFVPMHQLFIVTNPFAEDKEVSISYLTFFVLLHHFEH